MIHPAWGPFLFDTSAESRLDQPGDVLFSRWIRQYLSVHEIYISSATLIERIRGYGLLWNQSEGIHRRHVESIRRAYLAKPVRVVPIDSVVAVVAGEIMAALRDPPTPPRRAHRMAESRNDRLSRWRFDAIIAATALVARMPLLHNNPAGFEPIRDVIERFADRFPDLGPLQLIRYASLA